MKRAPANQASFFAEPTAPVAPMDPPPAFPTIAPPPLVRGSKRGKAPKDERIPRKLGDVFICWVCGKEKVAEKGTRAWWVQYGHHKTSGHLRLIACSTKCDRKRPWCCNCGAEGHDKSDGPEVCARYYKGLRNRALPLYRCYAHRIVDRHLTDKAQGWTPGGPPDTLAKLLIEHGGDFSRIREVISTAYGHPHPAYADEFGNRLLVLFEQAMRDDPDYGVEYPRDTPEQIVARAKLSVAQHRDRLSRQGRSLDGHMSEADALSVIADKMAKTGAIQRAIDAYGARASTPDAERVLVPLLSREDSPIRASAAWALFTHRTERVRAAMLVRADVEDVPLLKAYLEQLGEQP